MLLEVNHMLLSKGLNVASDSYPTGTGFLPNLSSYMTPTKLSNWWFLWC